MGRLFIAVRPDVEVCEKLARLERSASEGVRWVPAEQWHCTLRFLGDADPHEVAVALDPLSDAGLAPVAAELGPVVSRLGRDVVCVPVSGLDALASWVRAATAHLGDPVDPRPFVGHLTLARLRGRGACGVAGSNFSARFHVHEVELVESRLGAGGVAHTTIGSWLLER